MKLLLHGHFAYDPFDLDQAQVRLTVGVTVTRRKGMYYGRIAITHPDGEEVWAGERYDEDCLEALRYVALAIGVQTFVRFPPPTPAPKPPAPPPPPASPAPARPMPAPSPLPAGSPKLWALRIGLGGELSYGLLPGGAAGGQAFGMFYRPGFFISLEVHMLGSIFPANVGRQDFRRQVQGSFLGGAIVPCARDLLKRVSLCGALTVGELKFAPVDAPRLGESALAASVGLRPAFEWPFGRYFMAHGFVEVAGILGGTPGWRDETKRGWQPSRVGVSGSAALSVRLP